jgi:hypothetical protein
MVPNAPMMMPGKKPAAKEPPLKPDCVTTAGAGHEEVWDAEAGLVAEGVGLAEVGEGVDAAVSLKHMLLLQV